MSSVIFSKIDPPLRELVDGIDSGRIALPDLQRPFVWKNAQVR